MIDKELIHQRNFILFTLIATFYFIQVGINISIEGLSSVFPPVFLFIVCGTLIFLLIIKKGNPKVTMYFIISSIYIYYGFLLNDSPYLVNYLFMLLGLPLSAIYQNYRAVILAGTSTILLTFFSFLFLHEEIFPNVGKEDFIYLVLFAIFSTAFLLLFIQITLRLWQEVNVANTKLEELAYYDPLTGAANRLLLKKNFDEIKDRDVYSVAILFMDMDNFKKINDTYGHDVGDYLLNRVVSRVKANLRDSDLLCRLGGDEFIILLTNVDSSKVENILERIQATLMEPIKMKDELIHVSASIGWAYKTEIVQADLEEMIKEADIKMYKMKHGDGSFASSL